MEEILNWIMENPVLAGTLLSGGGAFAIDLIMGMIPDRWWKYKGGVRWVLEKMLAIAQTMPQDKWGKYLKPVIFVLRGLVKILGK